MKNLVFILMLCFVGNLFSQKFKLTDTIGKFLGRYDVVYDYDSIKEVYNSKLVLVRQNEPLRDSLKREFIQVESIKKLNEIRKQNGLKPLVFEELLRPAAYHNLTYNRYMYTNRISSDNDGWFLTHNQYIDIPNFNELTYPWDRIALLDQTKISSITEELTCDTNFPDWTFNTVCDKIWSSYKICYAHWDQLTKNPKWDCVFIYRDFENGIIITILGAYTKEYKEKMGLK